MNMMEHITSSVTYLTTVGNHESDWTNSSSYYQGTDSGGECGILSKKLYPMPDTATTNKPWWSYNVGLIHFIGISSEHDFTIGSEQYKWLENDLHEVNRKITPWIIFGAHRAMYINSNYSGSSTADFEVSELMITNLEPLLYKYKVNIGFYGHNHVVQRQSAVYNKTVIQHPIKRINPEQTITYIHDDPHATVHMIVGTGGASFTYTAIDGDDRPEWNELYFYKYGYAKVTAFNETTLEWKWIESLTDNILDHVIFYQNL